MFVDYDIPRVNYLVHQRKAITSNAIMRVALQKGKRVKVRRSIQCVNGFGLKFRRDLTRVYEGAPKVFR